MPITVTLNTYLSNTALLLQNPAAPSTLYSTANLSTFINTSRLQIAGETECVRSTATLSVTSVTRTYPFTSITGLPAGIGGVYSVRQATYNVGSVGGQLYSQSRPYPWAVTYWQNQATPPSGAPNEWSQYKIGDKGSIFIKNIPNATYVMNLDCVCEPSILTTDNDPEILPYPYTDAVPYLAAYYAYMSAQRQADAQTMLQRYQDFVRRAQKNSVPNVLPSQYDQNMSGNSAPVAQIGGG